MGVGRRDMSEVSNRGRRGTTMEFEEVGNNDNSPQLKRANGSSLSSWGKFSSLYDKVLEDSVDWDQKNIESLVSSQNLQQSTSTSTTISAQPVAVSKPRSKITFPRFITRGGLLVGSKAYCKTSINNCFTWRRQRSNNSSCTSASTSTSSCTSIMLMNLYHERSSDIQSGIALKITDPEDHTTTETMENPPPPPVDKRCRTFLLSVAGVAGMQLLFPSLRLPLFEALLLSPHHKWSTRKRSPLFDRGGGGGGWWSLPVNLALEISRPFFGSVLRRSLTALLFMFQLRVRKNLEQRSARHIADLNALPLSLLEKRASSVDVDRNLSSESLRITTTDAERENLLSWEANSVIFSEVGENSAHVEELIKIEDDFLDEISQTLQHVSRNVDVGEDDGVSSSGESLEQEVISDDGLSSSGDSSDQDLISEEEISSISISFLKDLDLEDYESFEQTTDSSHPHEGTEQLFSQPYDTAFSQPYDSSPIESPTETCSSSSSSSIFTTETCSTSNVSTTPSVRSDLYSEVVTTSDDTTAFSPEDSSIAWVENQPCTDVTRDKDSEDSEETHSHLSVSTSSIASDVDSVSTGDNCTEQSQLSSDTFNFPSASDSEGNQSTLSSSTSGGGIIDPVSIVSTEENLEGTHCTLEISSSSSEIDPDSVVTPRRNSDEIHSNLVSSRDSVGSDPDSGNSSKEDADDILGNLCLLIEQNRKITADTIIFSADLADDMRIPPTPSIENGETHSHLVSSTDSVGSDPDSGNSSKEDSDDIFQNQYLHIEQNWEITADTLILSADLADDEQIPPTRSIGNGESCFSIEQQLQQQHDEMAENAVTAETVLLEDEILFPYSEEFQFHDDMPPSPCEMSRLQEFLEPSSSEKVLEPRMRDTDSTPTSSTSIQQVSPRADLTALMPEELCSGVADGTWEIEVDGGLEVVWTPFRRRRRVLLVSEEGQEDSEDSASDFSTDQSTTADDTDSCKSADGSQMGREDEEELRDNDTMIVQKNSTTGPSNSVLQDQQLDHQCVGSEIGSKRNFVVDFSSQNRFSVANSNSSQIEKDARDQQHDCIPSIITTEIARSNEDVRDDFDDFEFRSADGSSVSEAVTNAEGLTNAFEGMKRIEASAHRVKLTLRLDGEELFGLKAVIPDLQSSYHSSEVSTGNSLTRRLSITHHRGSPAAEVAQHFEDKDVDDSAVNVVERTDSKNLNSLTVAETSIPQEFDTVRIPVVAHVDEKATVESQHPNGNKSLGVSVSSCSFLTAFSDDVDGRSPETPSESSTSRSADSSSESSDASTSLSFSSTFGHFANHPTCLHLRKVRHSHGDQVYLQLPELLSEPWCNLVYWHGRCREGRPTLVVLLGKAVRHLSSPDLKRFITVTISHAEYAELNFFKGEVKQLNILMDLDGLGFMRLPPMHVLQSIGTTLNRDYAGRGGWIFMVNAPMMLGLVISTIQRVILRPTYPKGDVIDKGFLEGKERIVTLGARYKSTLLKHFDADMLPSTLGGTCAACSGQTRLCNLGLDNISQNS